MMLAVPTLPLHMLLVNYSQHCGAVGTFTMNVWRNSVLLSLAFISLLLPGFRTSAQAPANEANELRKQAGQLDAKGDYEGALRLAQRALAIREKENGPMAQYVAALLTDLGEYHSHNGQYAAAELHFKRALDIYEKALGPDHEYVAYDLYALGNVYTLAGRYLEAETLFRRALTIRENVLGRENADVANTLSSMALLYKNQGRFADAEAAFERALDIYKKTIGTQHTWYSTTLANLAGLYAAQHRQVEAENAYKQVLEIDERIGGASNVSVAITLGDMGSLYDDLGRNAEAESFYKRALALKEKLLSADHPEVALVLHNLGAMYQRTGRMAEAEPLLKRALAARQKWLPNHPRLVDTLYALAALRERGRTPEGYQYARQALAIIERRVQEGAQEGNSENETERRYWRRHIQSFLSLAASYNPVTDDSYTAMQLATRTQADKALSQASLRWASSSGAIALLVRQRQGILDRRATAEKAIFSAALVAPANRDASGERTLRDEVTSLDRELASVDAQLRQSFPEFAEISIPRPLALADTQRLLAPNEALVSFVVAEGETYRFIVRRDGAELRTLKIGRSSIVQTVKALRLALDPTGVRTLKDLRHFDANQAYELFRTLFADSDLPLANAKHLLIVPDGALGGLPFAILPTAPPGDVGTGIGSYRQIPWLTRSYAVTVLPSIASLRALRVFASSSQVPREPFQGYGDPDLRGRPGDTKGKAVERLVSRSLIADVAAVRELDALPETRVELQSIAAALKAGSGSVNLREQATERRVKSTDLSQFQVIAFATHGLMAGDFEGYGEPALVLTPPVRGDEIDDGLLSASEIAQLKLNADWVILSACNTAASDGSPGAEGLSGLARAFFYAGSRALLVSHWPVLSDASVRLTTGAIVALTKDPRIGRAEALRRSMIALLDDPNVPDAYAHPAVWAPFSLVGEGGATGEASPLPTGRPPSSKAVAPKAPARVPKSP